MLELKNVAKTYDRKLFSNLNIKFPNAGFVCILGESGSGKSTILNIIAGLETIDEGEIIFNNKKIDTTKDFEILRRNHISFLFQDYGLLDSHTIKTNVLLSQMIKREKSNDSEIKKTLEDLNLTKELSSVILNLSGGEKQRVALARVLLNPKNIILCDEPSGSLDEKNTLILFDKLKKISATKLVIVVTHDRKIASNYADAIFDMKNKKMNYKQKEMGVEIIDDADENKGNISLKDCLNLSINSFIFRKGRFALSICSYIFVMIFLLICFSCRISIEDSLESQVKNFINYNHLKVSIEESKPIGDTNFNFVKSSRPDREEIEELLNGYHYQLNYSLDYIFNKAIITSDEKTINCQICPIDFLFQTSYSKYANRIKEMSLEDVYINEALSQQISNELTMSFSCTFESSNESYRRAYDEIVFEDELNVLAIVEEFNFMSIPTIYYSNQAAIDYLRNQPIKNASFIYKKEISFYDRISYLSQDTEEISSYCYDLYIDEEKVEEVSLLLEKKGFTIYSNALNTKKNIINIFSSIEKVLEIFVIISFIIVLFLVGIIIYSFVIDRKKEIGLLAVSGVSRFAMQKMFCLEGGVISLLSGSISLLLIKPVLKILNIFILKKCNIPNLLNLPFGNWNGVVLGFEFSLLVMTFLIGIVSGFVPSYLSTKLKICDILREE